MENLEIIVNQSKMVLIAYINRFRKGNYHIFYSTFIQYWWKSIL